MFGHFIARIFIIDNENGLPILFHIFSVTLNIVSSSGRVFFHIIHIEIKVKLIEAL